MRKITRRGRFRCWLATSLAVGLGLGLAPAAPRQSRASQIASTIKLDAEDLDHPIVLDQNGQTIELPTKQQSGPVVLTDGAVPSYIAYQVGGDDSLPQRFPTVDSGSANSNQTTTGPLHLDALVKAQLDQTLAKDGRAAVYNGQDTTWSRQFPPCSGPLDHRLEPPWPGWPASGPPVVRARARRRQACRSRRPRSRPRP